MTLLSYDSKYVVQSSTQVSTTSATLVDDAQAIQTFSLAASQTVVVFYQASKNYGHGQYGLHTAIKVDTIDYAHSYDSGDNDHDCQRNCSFWIGTLGAGSHTIKGRFCKEYTSAGTVYIDYRTLTITILDGNEFQYVDSTTQVTTTGTTLTDDTSASVTFTPSGTCKALYLYNASNSGAYEESESGQKVAIRIGSVDYSQAEKSGEANPESTSSGTHSVFTAYANSLSAVSTTVKGRFAAAKTGNVAINSRQLGVLLFNNMTELDVVSSTTQKTTTSSSLQNDTTCSLVKIPSTDKELLAIIVASKRYNTSSSTSGERYGLAINGTNKVYGRTSCDGESNYPSSIGMCWAQSITAGTTYTLQGQFSNNTGTKTAKIDFRIMIAIWLPTTAGAIAHVKTYYVGCICNVTATKDIASTNEANQKIKQMSVDKQEIANLNIQNQKAPIDLIIEQTYPIDVTIKNWT